MCTKEMIAVVLTSGLNFKLNSGVESHGVECFATPSLERLLEDHQLILEEIRAWPKETNNHLVFRETQKKYGMFNKSQAIV